MSSSQGSTLLSRITSLRWLPLGTVPEVTPDELAERLSRGERIQIVDVRTHREFSNGHIHGAMSVPIQSLPRRAGELGLAREMPVITICKTAHRSIPATRLLRARGFDAAQLATGMDGWRRQGLPIQEEPDRR